MEFVKRIKKARSLNSLVIILLVITQSSVFSFAQDGVYFPDIGVCTGFTDAGILAKHGYNYVEEGVGRFLVPLKSEEEFSLLLESAAKAELPVKACNSFIPATMKSVGNEAVHKDILLFAETAFRRAQKTGVEIIVFGSGGSRSIPEGFSREEARFQFISLCSAMGPIAARYGVTIVIEPLNKKECNFINSVAEGGEIVNEVNHPNIRLLADIYHMKMDDEGPESILKYGHLIKHVHVAEKEARSAPGTYNEDLSSYYSALKSVGYKGRISIECRWENMESQADKAIETIKKQL